MAERVGREPRTERNLLLGDVEQHLVRSALLHYRHYLKAELEEIPDLKPDNPEVRNLEEWLDRTRDLEQEVQKLIDSV